MSKVIVLKHTDPATRRQEIKAAIKLHKKTRSLFQENRTAEKLLASGKCFHKASLKTGYGRIQLVK